MICEACDHCNDSRICSLRANAVCGGVAKCGDSPCLSTFAYLRARCLAVMVSADNGRLTYNFLAF